MRAREREEQMDFIKIQKTSYETHYTQVSLGRPPKGLLCKGLA